MSRLPKEKRHLLEKRKEIIYALDVQDYNGQDIATIFNIDRSVVNRILKTKPTSWKPKWIKAS